MLVKVVNKGVYELPKYQTEQSAGMDLYANVAIPITIEPFGRALVPTGLYMAIENGYEGQIRPRSGLALKNGITVLNTPGTIDSDYRGEVKVLLVNLSDQHYTIRGGDRIAQIVFAPVTQARLVRVDSLEETERNVGGFGSTGK